MASWIEGTSAQRFYGYTLPAAKKAIASNYKEIERKRIAAIVADLRAKHAVAENTRDRVKFNRRIRAQLTEWFRVCEAWRQDHMTIETAK